MAGGAAEMGNNTHALSEYRTNGGNVCRRHYRSSSSGQTLQNSSYPSTMSYFLGKNDDAEFEREVVAIFSDSDLGTKLLNAPDRTMAALLELSFALNDLPIDEKRRLEIDKSIIIIIDSVSTCQRLFSTPVPLVYTRHTARFLTIWMLLLPFSLYEPFSNAILIPAVSILSFFLFGVQELSITLEEPFSVLNMQAFCDDIKRTTADMHSRARAQSDLPGKVVS